MNFFQFVFLLCGWDGLDGQDFPRDTEKSGGAGFNPRGGDFGCNRAG
jgi:hypothetical protein